jgi:hypothetical protein
MMAVTISPFSESTIRLKGKKGLIVGIANDQSIAWGCAKETSLLKEAQRASLPGIFGKPEFRMEGSKTRAGWLKRRRINQELSMARR